MESELNVFLGLAGFFALVFLPGAWITFGFRLPDFSFWSKLLVGTMLTPLVVCLQYYGIRLLGPSFETTALLLVFLNLPAAYFIFRQVRTGKIWLPSPLLALGGGLVVLVPVVALLPQLWMGEARAFTGHAWMHTDTIYMIANGELLLEDPMLVGVRHAYPWVGHVYQAVLSYLLDSPPPLNYIWTNILWLLFASGLTAGIVAVFGGNDFSKITSVIWFAFGLNFIGYVLHLGDYRYTPLLMKYVFFDQMPFALGTFLALVLIMVKKWPQGLTTSASVVVWLLLCSIGLIYPILFPPACAVVGARIVALFVTKNKQRLSTNREIVYLGVVLVTASILFLIHFELVFRDRVASEQIQLNLTTNFIRKVMDSAVAPLAFVISYGFVAWRYWKTKRVALIVTGLGALASLAAYMIILIPPVVEYKFMLTAVLALVPFPALALEPVMNRLGSKAIPVFVIITLILSAPMARKMVKDWPWLEDYAVPPHIDVQHFSLRLADTEKYAELYDVIRYKTPTNSIIVTAHAEHDLPTLTRRQLYVPPDQTYYVGVNKTGDHLLVTNRGYSQQILADRRMVLDQMFFSENANMRRQALEQILLFNRPVVIILEEQEHRILADWLAEIKTGKLIYRSGDTVLWVIDPGKNQFAGQPDLSQVEYTAR